MQYPPELRKKVGLWLKENPQRGNQKIVASCLGVETRTLRSWKTECSKVRKRGRPAKKVTYSELHRIVKEWKRQGRPGWRPVAQGLSDVRIKLVQNAVSALKLRARKKMAANRAKLRVSIRTKNTGVVVGMDGATIRKGEDLIIVRDQCSLGVEATSCRGSLNSTDTLGVLNQMKSEERLPLVLKTDNGSPFCSNVVEDFLENNQVIHLRSLPRVPQHNGSCENAVREIKDLLKSGMSEAQACSVLNEGRKRSKLKWKTSSEVDRENKVSYNIEQRSLLYKTVKLATKMALLGTKNGYERRKAERKAILTTLESLGLITITRGGQICA